MTNQNKARVLVFGVQCERTIESGLSRIPASLAEDYEIVSLHDKAPLEVTCAGLFVTLRLPLNLDPEQQSTCG